jgi:sigma-E factor negative regulatory protein RseC
MDRAAEGFGGLIEQQARVIRIEEDIAWVSVGGQSGCPACDAGKGCGAGVFGRLLRRKPVELPLPNEPGARAGQAVTLGIPESLYLKLVFRQYGWPLLAGLAGALASHHISKQFQAGPVLSDAITLAGMAGAAALAFAGLRKSNADLPAFGVRIVASAAEKECNLTGT